MKNLHLQKFPSSQVNSLLSWVEKKTELTQWSGSTFESGFSNKIFLQHIRRSDLHSLAYLNSNNILIAYGEIIISKKNGPALCRVIVNPEHRGVGLGTKFCNSVISWVREFKKFESISLNTLSNNIAAIRCYENLGFKKIQTKHNKRFINGSWQKLVIMRLKL